MLRPKEDDTSQREDARLGADARRHGECQCGIELTGQAEMPNRNTEIAQRDDRGEHSQIFHFLRFVQNRHFCQFRTRPRLLHTLKRDSG